MTSFDDRYRLLKCVALGGGIRTHNAQEASTGRPVMVHANRPVASFPASRSPEMEVVTFCMDEP